MCTFQVDSIGKECLDQNKHLYPYRNTVGIPPLGMVDDLLAISKCGIESVKTNAYLNIKTSLKKLQFGENKCKKMHIGPKNVTRPKLFIDKWKVKRVSELEPFIPTNSDIYDGDYELNETEDERYLGDILSRDGKNEKNIKARVDEAYGIINKIKSILDESYFGPFQFQIALMLRNAMFMNSILLSSEAWYRLTKRDIEKFEEKN